MILSKHEIWDKALYNIQSIINKQSFDMWLKDTEPISYNENKMTIRVADEVAQRHISDNYSSTISSIVSDIAHATIMCEFTTDETKSDPDNDSTTSDSQPEKNIMMFSKEPESGNPMLKPEYTFENFVVGPNNQLPHAAAVSVSKAPATQYNPLFIYGGTGLGKTHLMQAIGHSIMKEKPYMKVLYITTEQFLNEFIHAISTNTLPSFKMKYRDVDILLIDDIQFIEKKEQTQEEFFHTFNTLHNNKKQIIISSDRPPKDLSTLEVRLRTRFEWGLITDIQPPNVETREAILRNKAERLNIDIPDEILNFIARRIKSSIRALEAALIRLNAVSSLSSEPISIYHAKNHLKDLFDEDTSKKITITDIIQRVSEKYNISVEDLKSKSRHSRVVHPRFIAMYISRKLTDMTTVDIGREFGDRDHSTVLNAMNNVEKMMADDEDFQETVEDLISEIRS
ncbi:MAG TPA: chromosomal replication initiator protein DnaA [Spirochaetota bacterium]|nr:chromosomal replication initiator protein DnaA [Spirochaetota bacterium]HPJ37852.1 chromosomal replication initiator protein DnaA [Spirochaetota bacterium]HPQ51858.1 chromosomal replication initiator protein DnaA [Spirochaetota bacterium]